jgi:hypothetical protein
MIFAQYPWYPWLHHQSAAGQVLGRVKGTLRTRAERVVDTNVLDASRIIIRTMGRITAFL